MQALDSGTSSEKSLKSAFILIAAQAVLTAIFTQLFCKKSS
jgi:hypothetical protein